MHEPVSPATRRRSRPAAVCLFSFTLSVFAVAAYGDDAEPKATPATSSLSGRVLDPEGQPVARARVGLYLDDVDAEPRTWREVKSVETDETGTYEFPGLPKAWYLLVAEREGFAKAFRYSGLEEGQRLANEITLRPPVAATVLVRDKGGRPVAGARLRNLNLRGENGEFWFRKREDWRIFDMPVSTSDEAGQILLPPLPQGTVVTGVIDHPDLAPAEIKDIAVRTGVASEVTLSAGAMVSLKIAPDEQGGKVDEVEIDLRHDPFSHPSTVIYDRLPLDADGDVRLTVEPGRYSSLWLKHPNYLLTPWYSSPISKGEFLRIGSGEPNAFSFRPHRKVKVRGRVIDVSSGKPMAKIYVQGQIPNVGPDGETPEGSDDWAHAGWGETDEKGEFAVDLAAGRVRVRFEGQGYVGEQEHLEFEVAADGSTVAPDLRVRPMPKVAGRVVDPAGQPVAGAVVRFRGELRHVAPTTTGADGRFELAPPWVPVDYATKESKPVQPLVAFHPHERLSARTTLWLTDADSLGDVTLTLGPEEPASLLDDFRDELTLWERGEIEADRAAEMAAGTLKNQPALELDGTWLNIKKPSEGLAAFRGKYVLSDVTSCVMEFGPEDVARFAA